MPGRKLSRRIRRLWLLLASYALFLVGGVVLLRDSDLSAFNGPWPPRYGFHARFLRTIRANKPKVVMMDIVFEDVRDDPTIEVLATEQPPSLTVPLIRTYHQLGLQPNADKVALECAARWPSMQQLCAAEAKGQ